MNAAVQLAERLDADPFAAAHWPPPVDEVVAARRIAMLDRGWSPAQDQPGHYIPSTPTDPRDFYRPPETWPTELLTDYLGILEQSADADSREAAEIREIVAKRQG